MQSITIKDTAADLGQAAAQHLVALIQTIIQEKGHCAIALCSGQTITQLFAAIKTHFLTQLPWHQVSIYFTDERYVPVDHPDNNYQLIRNIFLNYLSIPAAQIHRINTESNDPALDAAHYTALLAANTLDIVIVSMAADGHIASLFPGTEILQVTDKTAAAVYITKLNAWRISLTLPALNATKHVLVLISGENKADIVAEIYGNKVDDKKVYPLELITPPEKVDLFLDAAAASKLY